MLLFTQIIFTDYGFYGAFRLAHRAVNTFLRIYHQHIRPFMKAVYRTDFDTVRIFTLNARLSYNKRHENINLGEMDRLVIVGKSVTEENINSEVIVYSDETLTVSQFVD